MTDEDGKRGPEDEKEDADTNDKEEAEERHDEEREPNRSADQPHHEVHEKITEEFFRVTEDVHFAFFEASEGRKERHDHLRNRKKMVDEPEIIQPDPKEIGVRGAVMPYEIISRYSKKRHVSII